MVAGPACSDTVEPLVGVAETFKTVVMSYSAEGAIFNYSKYPYFFRTIPENKIYGYDHESIRLRRIKSAGNSRRAIIGSLPSKMFTDL